jgi:hypothetical protein
MKSSLGKFMLVVGLAGAVVGCAGAPQSRPAAHADTNIVQGGSLAGEGMIYFPIGLPNNNK